MYSDALLDHFQSPRNAGEMAAADGEANGENPVCGDRLHLSLRVADGKVEAVRWQADGCAPAVAAASMLSEMVTGMTAAEAGGVSREDLTAMLGGLPARKSHAIVLAVTTLHAALLNYHEHHVRESTVAEAGIAERS